MTFQERSAATIIALLLLAFGTYVVVVIVGVDRRVGDFAYKPLLILVIAFAALMAVSHIGLALLSPNEANTLDERDRSISQRSDQVGAIILGSTVLFVISLTMFEVAHVYIANALLLGLVAAQIASEATKLWLYRRTS